MYVLGTTNLIDKKELRKIVSEAYIEGVKDLEKTLIDLAHTPLTELDYYGEAEKVVSVGLIQAQAAKYIGEVMEEFYSDTFIRQM